MSEAVEQSPSSEARKSSTDFFAAIRYLQVISGKRIGDDTNVGQEPIVLKALPAVNYPATEVATIQKSATEKLNAVVTFLGLFGPSGALPQHYTQTIIDRIRAKDTTMADFLDLFNHRWLSLYYRGWEKNFLPASFETAQANRHEDAITQLLWCLVGLGEKSLRKRVSYSESVLLHYSGHASASRPTVESLRAVLSDAYSLTVHVKQYQGQWLYLEKADQSRLGEAPLGSLLNNRLGMDTVAGTRVWSVENRFRVVVGPVRFSRFLKLSPDGSELRPFLELIRTFVGPQFDFNVQVLLDRRDVPGTTLVRQENPSRLGWNTWLGNWPKQTDADDAVFYEGN
jgi:type VI secretion system protein ImpH